MKRMFAMLAILGLLVVPVLVSADDDVKIPPEANWSATPPTPATVAVPQQREAAIAQGQEGRRIAPVTVRGDQNETVIPPETNWTSRPATPAIVAMPQRQEAAVPQALETVPSYADPVKQRLRDANDQ